MQRFSCFLLLACAIGCTRNAEPPAPAGVAPVAGAVVARQSAGLAAREVQPRTFAALPDRGELTRYDATPARREGAYTSHPVEISEAHALAAIDGVLDITAPDGARLKFRYERHVEHPSGDWTWIGRLLDGPRSSEAIITFGAQAVFGAIDRPGRDSLRLVSRGGRAWMVDSDPSRTSRRAPGPDFLLPPTAGRAGPSSTGAPTAAGATATAALAGDPTIDVLIGFTPGFAADVGGTSGALTRLNNLVEVANQAYANSQVATRMRLVHAMQVNYADATSNGSALEAMSGYQSGTGPVAVDPAFNALRAARETHGADLVALVRKFHVPENQGCGIAWLIGGGRTPLTIDDEPFGYSVVSDGVDSDTTGTYYCADETLVHEIGHNMGSAHDVEEADGEDGVLQSDEYGRYAYSFGYKAGPQAGNFFTVMAYGDAGQVRYRTFSNPDTLFCGGQPCGTADADNASSLRLTSPIVATFRAAVTPGPAAGVRNDVDGDARTDLVWFKPGALDVWYMSGASVRSSQSYLASSQMQPYVTGVFNAGAAADIGWRDDTGAVVFWLGGPPYKRGTREYAMSFSWRLQAAGDHDGDGHGDLYWRSAVDGRVMYWLLDGTQQRTAYRAFTQSPDFDLVATGDFNNDARTDLFFRRRADGQTALWEANGTSFLSSGLGALSKYWAAAGAGDYDGDGDDDLVWRSTIDHRVLVWIMQDGQRVDAVAFASDATRALLAAGDTNGDGRMDLVWRRNDGAVSVWLGSASGFTSRYVGTRDTSWQLVKGGL